MAQAYASSNLVPRKPFNKSLGKTTGIAGSYDPAERIIRRILDSFLFGDETTFSFPKEKGVQRKAFTEKKENEGKEG